MENSECDKICEYCKVQKGLKLNRSKKIICPQCYRKKDIERIINNYKHDLEDKKIKMVY